MRTRRWWWWRGACSPGCVRREPRRRCCRGGEAWRGTTVRLPKGLEGAVLENLLTGERFTAGDRCAALADALRHMPWAAFSVVRRRRDLRLCGRDDLLRTAWAGADAANVCFFFLPFLSLPGAFDEETCSRTDRHGPHGSHRCLRPVEPARRANVPPNTPGYATGKSDRRAPGMVKPARTAAATRRHGETRDERRPGRRCPAAGKTPSAAQGGAIGNDRAAVAGERRAETRDANAAPASRSRCPAARRSRASMAGVGGAGRRRHCGPERDRGSRCFNARWPADSASS
jgi:hypothetical protein